MVRPVPEHADFLFLKIYLNKVLALKCATLGCGNFARLGGHVWLKGRSSNEVCYIVPLCSSCNNKRALNYNSRETKWFELKKDTQAMSTRVVTEMFTEHCFFKRRNVKDSYGSIFSAFFACK